MSAAGAPPTHAGHNHTPVHPPHRYQPLSHVLGEGESRPGKEGGPVQCERREGGEGGKG